jgi:alanyl-tRNA synthetase
MQNVRGEGGGKDGYPILGELPAKNIDTGLGLERTAALLQGVENIYEIDTTAIILNRASDLTQVKYGKSEKNDVSLRVIADHARTAVMLIGDGVLPGNEGRGYVLRRMMRRTIRNMRLLGSHEPTAVELAISAIQAMGPQYPELVENQERILAVTAGEEEAFLHTLKSGTAIFDLAVFDAKKSSISHLDGETVFKLHDTYGFPFDLTLEMASESGLNVDGEGFKRLMKEQKDRAKADARAKKTGHTDLSEYRKILDSFGQTKFTGYSHLENEAVVNAILVDGKNVNEVGEKTDVEIVLNTTPFYAEGGGQLPDGGLIRLSNGAVIEIDDVQQPVPGLYVHRGEVVSGSVSLKDSALATIDKERRFAISRAHTATHMVHKAFRELLGETATQAGSENAPGRFRFDFPSPAAVSPATLSEVEGRVNSLLIQDMEVSWKLMTQPEAKAMGAMALFGEKYGDQVRVVSVGDWAHELCGGTHVARSGELGVVKLLSEASIGSGVRRIEALVGADAYRHLAKEHIILDSITRLIKGSRVEELPARISALMDSLKQAEKEIAAFNRDKAMAAAQSLLASKKSVGSGEVLLAQLPQFISADDLRIIALDLRNKLNDGVVILASQGEEKTTIVAAVSDGAKKAGVSAGALIKVGSAILGGGGGGKDDFAQGGGVAHDKCDEAFTQMLASVTQSLS